jgi:hypothetical protein
MAPSSYHINDPVHILHVDLQHYVLYHIDISISMHFLYTRCVEAKRCSL